MFLRSVIAGQLCLLYSCSNNLELPEGKKTIAQFVFLLPDRAELTSEVANIDEQMNAYRLSIVPDDSQNSEDCDSVGMLKKYEDNKEIEIELKANCAYSVSLNLGAYQTTPKFIDEDEESDGSDLQDGFSLTDEDETKQIAENGEDTPPLDFVFYETSFDLQKGQTVTGIVQHNITVNVTRDGQKIGLETSELDVEIPASPGISQVKQLSDESAGDNDTGEKEQRFVGYDTIGPVIDQRCASADCHAAGGTSPDLSSFSRISNGTYGGEDITEAIYKSVIVVKNMPFSGKLSQEELSLFEDWKQSGFVE